MNCQNCVVTLTVTPMSIPSLHWELCRELRADGVCPQGRGPVLALPQGQPWRVEPVPALACRTLEVIDNGRDYALPDND